MAVDNTVVAELERLLAYHKLLGIDFYPSRDDLTDFLAFEIKNQDLSTKSPELHKNLSHSGQERQSRPTSHKSQPVSPRSEPVAQEPSPLVDLQDLCSSCTLRTQQKAFISGKGGDTVRLLVVGGWLINTSDVDSEKTTFGVEEDIMLARMFSAMKLAPSDVFVTNLVKCCLDKEVRPSEANIESCQRLLQQQIIELQPEIICAMGTLAARTLLQKERSLSQLRGKFFQTEVVKGMTLPVFATYHPSYLVHNEEMKVPTWEDLQKIARRLATKKRK